MRHEMNADRIGGGGAAGAYEVQRQNAFLLSIDIPSGGKDVIELTLKESDLPKVELESIDIHYMNEYRKLAGKPKVEDFTFTCHDVIDKHVAKSLYEWWTKVYDPYTGAIHLAKEYKKDATLTLLSPDGATERTWILIGCWPKKVSLGRGDMSKADPVGVEVTLAVDKVRAINP